MDLEMKKNQLLPHLFNYDTEMISKILDKLHFGLLEKMERVGQPLVDETFGCPVGWVHHLSTNSDIRFKFLDSMIQILSVLQHLSVCYKLSHLLADWFYAKNVVQNTGFVRLGIFCLLG
jgi:hypothetical protein